MTSIGRRIDDGVLASERKLRDLLEAERRIVRVTGPTGAGKSAVVQRVLAMSGRSHVLWLDHAVVSSPGALWGGLAFALGLAPQSRYAAIRRTLETVPHTVVIDGVHGGLGALEGALAGILGARTELVLVGRNPELRLIPTATVAVPAPQHGRPRLPVMNVRQLTWLQALAILGGGVALEDACALGRTLGVTSVEARLAELLRTGDLLGTDPHDPWHVRVAGYVRRALVAAAEPAARRAALAFVAARARGDAGSDDRRDFEDAARRLMLLPLAPPEDLRILADASARWALRWGTETSALFAPFAPVVKLTPGRAAVVGSALGDAAFVHEAWGEAVAAFESTPASALTPTQHAAWAWSLIELGRHEEAGRHLAVAEARSGGTVMRAEPSAARALAHLDRGHVEEAESRLSHEVMNAALKGRRRAAAQARFWLMCVGAIRARVEPFYALAVASELQHEDEPALAAFARALAAGVGARPGPVALDPARHPSTLAAIDVLHGAAPTDGAEPEGLLVRIAHEIVGRA